jgi:hypothetical protein
MANTCTTEINVNASESAIDWLENLVKNYTTEDFIGQFASGAELFIDKVGSKWITLMDQYRVESQKYFISFESAWYPPETLMKNIFDQLSKIDDSSYLDGRYWDEGFSPIGIFEVNLAGYKSAEDHLSVDWDNEYYWEEEVEPAFNNLEI